MRPGRGFDVDPTTIKLDGVLKYDQEKGELQELIDGQLQSIIAVRTQLMEDIARQAVIIELERLGYTVTAPGQ